MPEAFLHHLWKFRLFDEKELVTEDGESIKSIKTGVHNRDAGPDFFNARIEINNTNWAGNVEIHWNSSDWNKHNHSSDPAYENVILHVVYENTGEVKRKAGSKIPLLVLKNRINPELLSKYHDLQTNEQWIPCEKHIENVDDFLINSWTERLVVERLELKSLAIEETLKNNNNNWEETFYQHLARNFGFKVNALPFEMLARSLPNNLLAKHKNEPKQIESLIFGQAGLLEDSFTEEYPKSLKKEYEFLQKKYNLKPLDKSLWKFLRLRPVNFPSIRLAQFATLICSSSNLFSKVLETKNKLKFESLFSIQPNSYWETHFMFEKETKEISKSLGNSSIENIIINTIAPFFFVYGKHKNQQKYIDQAIELLDNTQSENNSIIKNWNRLGIRSTSAIHSQGLIQLKNNYCASRKCIDCHIGNKIIR